MNFVNCSIPETFIKCFAMVDMFDFFSRIVVFSWNFLELIKMSNTKFYYVIRYLWTINFEAVVLGLITVLFDVSFQKVGRF